jgi:transcriptional regulator with XRE-family HTH domain
MSQIRRTISRQVRRYRRAKGLTQSQLAEAAQISVDSVAAIERQKSTPSLETLAQLTDVLSVELVDLIGSDAGPGSDSDQEIQELVDFLKVRSAGDVRFATDLVQRVFKRIEQG